MTLTDPTAVDLDDWLNDLTDAPIEPPTDADRADRMLGAWHRCQREAADVTALAAARRARIDEWEAAQLDRLAKRAADLEQALTSWHAAVLRTDPKRATITLPNGTLKATKVPGGGEWEWVDDGAVTAYLADAAPHLVTTPEPTPPKARPDKKAVKAAVVVVADVAAAREARHAFIAAGPPEHGDPVDVPPRFVAGTGTDGELVPVIDLDTGAPVPGVMVRRLTRRYRIEATP